VCSRGLGGTEALGALPPAHALLTYTLQCIILLGDDEE